MANNIVIAAPHPATVSVSPGTPALNSTTPVAYALDDRPGRVIEAQGSISLDLDLGEALPVNFVGIVYTNANENFTWQVRAADTAAGLNTGVEYVTAATDFLPSASAPEQGEHGRPCGFEYRENPVSRRFWRVTLTGDVGQPVRLSRVIIGQAIQPYWNYQLPSRTAPADKRQETETRTGQRAVELLNRRRRLSVILNPVYMTERRVLRAINSIAAENDAFICLNPDHTNIDRQWDSYFGQLVIALDKLTGSTSAATITMEERS